MSNVFDKYNLRPRPPCECAFVIVNPNTKVRTNIIKGTWHR